MRPLKEDLQEPVREDATRRRDPLESPVGVPGSYDPCQASTSS
jgi:hypothetical protein